MLMDTPTLRQLRTLIATSETGSVTAAARTLHQTQPAASQQLRALEHGLRVRLLERAEGRMVLTAAGAAIIEPARRAQAAAEQIAGDRRLLPLRHLRARPSRHRRHRLHSPAPPGPGPGQGAHAGAGDHRRHRQLRRNPPPRPGRHARCRADHRAAPARPPPAPHPIRRDPLLALVPTDLAPAAALTPAQLAAMPLILFEPAGDTRAIIDRWFRHAGLTPRPIMELGSVEAIKVLVGTGLGASVLPQLALGQPVPGAEIRRLRPPAFRDLALVMRKEKLLERGLRVLIESLQPAPPPIDQP